ncbi:hypothetical protein BDN70DRAFT_872451 [Pholiota conissans]|uniref:Uncharacterized protein n=1 Tax=Pholiota conissans TaxID=109636 RepID=A0A9P5ZC49_9AGAR|nr:hypothetical protein BDN70DRAFT_872451 [Pholiota conissans]
MDNTPPKPESVEKSSSPARQVAPADVPPQDDKVNTPSSRSGTPITSWEQSPSNSAPSPTHESKPHSIGTGNTTTSSLVPPTPAQRTKRPTFTPSDLPASSLPAAANESILDDASGHESGTEVRPPVSRKVPRPTSPQPRRHTGPALVLVPNSDTSGTQSQSLSLTQSQSQSQSQPQPLIQESDAQVESSAPNNAARPTKEEIREESDDDMAMEVDHEREERHRRSIVLGPEAASSGGESSSPEKSSREDDGRRYADGSETESDEDDDSNDGVVDGGDEEDKRVGTEMEADWSDDGYPWMTLWSVRGIIVKVDALREGLHNNVLR